MKREYPEVPLVGVGAIIVETDRVLLVKRGHPPLLGKWSIPGGVLEVGETLHQAAIREAREETGLDVLPQALLGVFDRLMPDDAGKTLYHYVLIDFLCRRESGELLAGGDADEVRWFSRDEVARLSLPAETVEVVRLGFEKAAV